MQMDSLIGKTVDNYRIIEVLGRGGMGVVFKALDTSLEKIVALKMIDPFLARDENFVRRFKTEAKALAKLENQNIVGVYALRETESGFFMVMEYVESKPLSQHLQENGPFSLADTISIAKQLLNAIGHAHKVGVIHRDIKPSNILICENGKIKVTDFGLAKVVEQKGPSSTVTQARAGTLYYMSPEQVKGLKNVDSKSDLYSLGISVYEMIAGRVPFDKTDSDFTIQKKIVEGEIPSPVKFNSAIPKKLTKIISKCIDKDPAKRYQTAEEMYADIESFEFENSKDKNIRSSASKSGVKTGSGTGFKINFKSPVMLISSIAALVILVILYLILSPSNDAFLSVSTTPLGSEIFIDGESVGKSPLEEFKIESDVNVSLKISKDGFITQDTSINIKSGENENLAIILNPIQKEKINIVTNPDGAKLIINNNFAGNSPLDNYSIRRGENNIRIEKVGYLYLDTLIRVEKDLAKTFNITLRKDPEFKGFGTLKITSRPIGALVLLNGELVGKTPYENKEQPVADYQLIIRQNGYSDYTESIKIVLNRAKTVSKQLTAASTSSGNQFGKLKVTTKPSEAAVYLNGEFVGSTPFESDKVAIGSHNLVIKKKGYGEISETVSISLNNLTPVARDLVAAGKLTVTSDPTGADVLINDKTVGKTPYTSSNLAIGDYTITITKSGFKPYTEKISIADVKSAPKISQKLDPLTGKIEILVRPYGSIYVDDEMKAQDSNSPYVAELPGGKHRIKLVHPTLGSTTKEIIVMGEKTQKYNFDLGKELKLTVVSNPPNSEIFLNGESTGKYTPTQLRLRAGSYRIMVKRDGYSPSNEEKYEVPSSIYEGAEDKEDRKEFTLAKIQ